MRILGAGLGVLGLLITIGIIGYMYVGIGGSSSPNAPAGSGRPGYVGRMIDARDNTQMQNALIVVRKRVLDYKALNDSFPASLDDLANKTGQALPALPAGMTWKYDPVTGNVDVE